MSGSKQMTQRRLTTRMNALISVSNIETYYGASKEFLKVINDQLQDVTKQLYQFKTKDNVEKDI